MKRMAKRKCELWISNNKVLVGGGSNKKPHARNPNFETEETKLLISLWGDPVVQKTLITTHKKHPVIQKLADKMREHGYYRSAEEINTRIKNLKCFYNRIKKDVELGVITEPTWKHYAAMEEIITRPVFGNRVQQPHLYNAQQQQKSQDPKYSWMKKIDTEEDSNELRPEDLLSVEEEMDEDDDDNEDDNNDYDEEDGDMNFEEASLVPKEEPIDIEDEATSDVADADDIFPKLSQYLQLASNQQLESKKSVISPKITEIKIKQSPPSTPVTPTPASTPSPISTPSTAVVSSAPVVIKPTSQPSKISLVPTNILMKPTATSLPQSSLNFSPQLFCAKSVSGTQTVYTTTSNGVPMKVLLVNTLQTPKSLPTQTPPLLLPKTVTSTSTKITTTTGIVGAKVVNKLPTATDCVNRNGTAGNVQANKSLSSIVRDSNGEARGFKGLLHRLINIQNESLAVNKQRLKLERQRLEFEQSMGKKLLNVLTKMASNSANDTPTNAATDVDKS